MEKPYNLKRPAGLEDYVIAHADVTYLIFSKKEETVYCTRCRKLTKTREAEWMEHKGKALCPHCGQEGETLNKRYGRKGITEYGRVLWFRKHGRITFAQLDEYDIDYTGVKPTVRFWPSAQYRLCKDSQEYYKHRPEGCWHGEYWEKKSNVYLPAPSTGMLNCFCKPKYLKTETHDSAWDCLGTDLKYANTDMLRLGFKDELDPYGLIIYLAAFLKWQAVELLEKAGFENIVAAKVKHSYSVVNWRGNSLRKILRLMPAEINEFRAAGGHAVGLDVYRTVKEKGYHMSFKQTKYENTWAIEGNLEAIGKYTDVQKVLDYLDTQLCVRTNDYIDYMKDCKTLGYDMNRKSVLFPEDFDEAHRKTSERIKIEADALKQAAFEKNMEKLYGKPVFESDGLIIRGAQNATELREESAALGHCVRTYVDKVCRGDCAILFIRKAEAPEKPYYTLEINKDGKVVQCRGQRNCSMTEEVEAFVELWKQNVMTKSKKRKEAA